MSFSLCRVPAETTYALRQQVLRPLQDVEDMRLAGDDDPGTASFAAKADDGTVVGTGTVRREPCPWQPERLDAWRLRGMATAQPWRGRGVGTDMLAAVVAYVADQGGGLLWCHARTPAQTLYRRGGFSPHGSVWEEPLIGPHLRMWHEVAARRPADLPSR